MKLFPSVIFRDDTSDGERRARALLEKIPASDGAFAIHSLNLPEHEYKRYSEADFVLIDQRGVLVIEVKGGVVRHHEGEWQFTNGRGQSRTKSEGPHQQAESAVQAVRNMLRRCGVRHMPSVFGWAVVFPFTNWTTEHPEIPVETVIARVGCEEAVTFAASIDRAFAYWRKRSEQSGRTIYPVDTQDYLQSLLPEFQYSPAPAKCAEAVWSDVVRLSERQCQILEGMDRNPRLLVEGGAGTGKTVLANAAARSALGNDSNVCFVIGAPLLAAYLAKGLPGVTVVSADQLQGLPSDAFDVLIVDEGQELVTRQGLTGAGRVLKGGLEQGRWRWFMDPDNQSMCNEVDPDSRRRLQDLATCWTPPHNVRSTREIVKLVQEALGADIGISEIDGRGVKPRVEVKASDRDALDWAAGYIGDKIESGVDPKDIVVLGAPQDLPEIRKGLGWLPDSEAIIVCGPQDIEAMQQRLIITDPMTFRGLERAWTIIVATEALTRLERSESYLYVGMTRANAGLAISLGPAGREWLYNFYSRAAAMTGAAK